MKSVLNDNMKEMVDAAHFAERELEAILGEISLQNEKLVDIQRKTGVTHSYLIRNSKLLDEIFKVTRPRLAIGIMVLFVTSVTLIYARIAFLG